MKKCNRLFKTISYAAIVALFAIISLSYFAPQLSGKVIRMGDVVQYEGMHQDITTHKAEYGEDPQWAGRLFGGMPSYLINFTNDAMLVNQIDKFLERTWRPASLIFTAMLGFWIMLLLWGVNPWLGAVFAVAYGLSSYSIIIIGAGHITKAVAIAYIPMLLGSVFYAFRKNMWIGAGLTSLFAALEIYANHSQITYYFLFVLVAFWINEGIKAYKNKLMARFAKTTALLALAAVVGVGANLSNLWYIQDYAKDTMRGGAVLAEESSGDQSKSDKGLSLDYVTMWSYGKVESLNMFVPSLMGGASDKTFSRDGEVADALSKYDAKEMATQLPAYWGDQPGTSGPTYIGAVMIFLAVFALFLLKGRYTYWVVAVSVLAIALAWGRNMMWFTELFFNYFPLYGKFRTVSMILVIVQWSVPFLAALSVAKVWSGDYSREYVLSALKKSVMVVGGVALALLLFGGVLFGFSGNYDVQFQLPDDVIEAMKAERASIMKIDAFRSLIFVMLTALVMWLFAKGRVKRVVVVVALMALTCSDMIPIGLRFLPQSRFLERKTIEVKPTTADIEILKDKELGYRVLNTSVSTFNDASTSYYHRSVGGYHAAKLQRYQDIITYHLSENNWNVYNMLNTKYIIFVNKTTKALEVELNKDAHGAAWFVDEVMFVDNPNQEIEALNSADTRYVAIVDEQFKGQVNGLEIVVDSMATVDLIDYKVNHLTYKANSKNDGVVVFSEVFYDKGWSAWLDGIEVPYFRTDYILRGMVVPAGEHTIEFKFAAPHFKLLSTITFISSLIAILGALAAIIYLVFKNYNVKDGKEVK